MQAQDGCEPMPVVMERGHGAAPATLLVLRHLLPEGSSLRTAVAHIPKQAVRGEGSCPWWVVIAIKLRPERVAATIWGWRWRYHRTRRALRTGLAG